MQTEIEFRLHSLVMRLNQRALARGVFELPPGLIAREVESVITEVCYDTGAAIARDRPDHFLVDGVDQGWIRLCTDPAHPDFGFSYCLPD